MIQHLRLWFLNLWVRFAYRVFRYWVVPHLPEIAKEMVFLPSDYKPSEPLDPECSTCVREYEEERARIKELDDWQKGGNK